MPLDRDTSSTSTSLSTLVDDAMPYTPPQTSRPEAKTSSKDAPTTTTSTLVPTPSEVELDALAADMGLPADLEPVISRQITRDIGPPPDGGRDAWLCVLSTFLVLFCIFGMVTSFGQLQAYYLAHQLSHYSKSTVAWIGSTQSTLTFIGSILAGRFFDSHGPRPLVIAGTILSVSALVGLAFCTEYYQFFLAHLLFGLSGTLTYSPATAISGHWFLKKRSTAVGIIVCGAGFGGVIYPIMMRSLFARMSFRNAILVIAGFNAVLMLPSCFWMKARLPPRSPPPWSALKAPWKESGYTFLVLGTAVYMLNVFSPYFNAPVPVAQNSLPPHIAEYSIAILQAGSFFGRATAGVLADFLGVWVVFGTMSFASSIVLFAFWTGAPGVGCTLAGLVLYGIVSGAWFTLVAAACASISPVREIGMRLGMLWTVVGPPILAGPVVCGVLISTDGGRFNYAGIFCGASMLIASFLMPGPRLWAAVMRCCGRREKVVDVESESESAEKAEA